jgi:large repetitive protein
MICNKRLGQSGRASSIISSSTPSSFGRFAAAMGAVVRPALLLLLGVALCGAEVQAQGVDFGSTAVGATSSSQTLTFNFTNSTPVMIKAPIALTGGVAGKDFAVVSGGSCNTTTSYSAGGTSSCTVSVTLTPAYPGLRYGAVELEDTSGNLIATTYVHGLGTAPQVVFNPGVISAFAGNATGSGTQTGGYKGDGGPATSAELFLPTGAAMDGAGNFYIADSFNNVVREVSASGTITTIAGKQSAGAGYSGDKGAATSAQLNQPAGLAVDGAGNLYIADSKNNVIRAVNLSTGIITTVAGTGTSNYTGDGGLATAAQLDYPTGVAVDGSGNLYISDSYNAVVREVNAATGIITTIAGDHAAGAGFSGDGGPATSAQIVFPSGLAIDGQGNLYIADSDNNAIRVVNSSTAKISTVAGTGGAANAGYSGDGAAATSAKLDYPTGVVVDPAGNIFIADTDNQVIRKVSATTQNISTVAGNNTQGFAGNGGVPTSAKFDVPRGLVMDVKGNLYVVDTGNNQVRKIDLADPPTISFASTVVGVTSSDSPQTVTVANIGNASLTIESNPAVATNFLLDGTNGCGVASSPIAAGASCTLALDFMPVEAGAPLTGTAILTNNSLNANTSPFATQVINLSGTATAASTSTAVASSANPSTANVAVTFKATVTNTASGSTGSPTGTVQFVVDGTNSGSPVSLSAASGTSSTASSNPISNLTVSGSPHTIKANYLNSDGNFVDSNGTLTGGQTITAAAATLAFTTVPSGAVTINTTANFTVTLTIPTGSVKPAGNVVFSQGSTTLCTQAISASAPYTASCSTNKLVGPSPATVTANYTDTAGNFTVSTPATTSVTLTQVTTSLAITANPSTPTVDASTILKAVLTVGSSSPNAPTGSISFTVNGVGVAGCSGTSPVPLTSTAGVYGAQCTTSILTASSSTIGATYNGDNNFANATAGPSTVTVTAATPVFTISAAPVSPATTIVVNSPVQFTATFSAPAPTAPTQPKGPIVLTQGTSSLCTITDVSVSLSCQAPGSAISGAGTLPITAGYTDSRTPPQFMTETYNNSSFSVTAGASNTSVSLTSGTAGVNQTATFTATVTSPNSGTSTPQGTVTFQITDPTGKSTPYPNVALTSGSASCPPYTFALSGAYTVKATYNPNPANFVSSNGTTTVTSIPDPTALTIGAANPASPIVNEKYSLTATVVPTYPATGAGVTAPTGGTVTFYPTGSPTTPLCTGTVINSGTPTAPVYTATASTCPTTPAGFFAAGSHAISATYTDSATPANFVTSSGNGTLVIQQDTPIVTPTATPTSIQVNQALMLSATVAPHYVTGTFAPTGKVTFNNGSTVLCTATLSAASADSETASCPVPYLDLQVKGSPYTFTVTYTPDSAGGVNFTSVPPNSSTPAPTVPVTVTPDSTTVSVTPSVTPGILGYASQTITYTITVTPSQTVSTSSTNPGVIPTGSITLGNISGLPFAPPQGASYTCGASEPIPTQSPFTILCSVTYPPNYVANNNTDVITAAYVPASTEQNFTGSQLQPALIEPVKNFALAFTTGTNGTVSSVVVTPGHTNINDPFVPNQTVATLSTSTTSSGIGAFTDTLTPLCNVTSASGAATDQFTCVAVPASNPPGGSPLTYPTVAYTVTVPPGATPGQYTINVSATDPTNAPTLVHTQTLPLNVVDTSSSGTTYSFTGVFAQAEPVNFGAPSGFSPTAVWCPQIQWVGTGSLPAGLPGNPFANQGTISTPGSSPTYLTCAVGTSPNTGSQLSINITPIQAKQTAANNGDRKSNGSYAAVVLAMPVLVFFGWFGRNRARKSFFRMMTVLLLAWSALSISGCGGGFKLTTPGSSSAPTVLPQGNYQVIVAAQDASNNTYYAIVTVNII